MSIREQIKHIGENLDKFLLDKDKYDNLTLEYIKYYDRKPNAKNYGVDNVKGKEWWIDITMYKRRMFHITRPFITFHDIHLYINTGHISQKNIELNKDELVFLRKKIRQRKKLPNPKEENRVYWYVREEKKEPEVSLDEQFLRRVNFNNKGETR